MNTASETHKHNGCECDICNNYRAFQKHMALIPLEQQQFFDVVYDDLQNTKFDLDYYKVIHDGSWPGAVEILERALERAKAKRAERDNDAAA
jgi:hypothetical protein